MNKKTLGLINQKAGYRADGQVKNILENFEYNVTIPDKTNNKTYDLLAIKNARKYMIQVKTDGIDKNGKHDGKFALLTPEKKEKLCDLAKEINYTPILINYHNNQIDGYYVYKNKENKKITSW